MRGGKTLLRAVLTAPTAACLAVRVVRLVQNWPSVRQFFFPEDGSSFWQLVGLALLLLPLLLPVAAGVSLWWGGRLGAWLGLLSAGFGGFSILAEGLLLFARSLGGNSGYVGAEPALSAIVCLCAAVGLALFHRGDLDPYL